MPLARDGGQGPRGHASETLPRFPELSPWDRCVARRGGEGDTAGGLHGASPGCRQIKLLRTADLEATDPVVLYTQTART